MSTIAETDAVSAFMKAIASGEAVSPRLARDSGFDSHVLQHCIDLASPMLDSLEAYQPLVVHVREYEGIHIVSEQDILAYRESLLLMRLYVMVSKDNDLIHEARKAEVFVCKDGTYVVAISEKPDHLKQDQYTKERIAQIIECSDAAQLGGVLNPLLLQKDRFHDYDERFRVLSPLSLIADALLKVCASHHGKLLDEAKSFKTVLAGMEQSQRFQA